MGVHKKGGLVGGFDQLRAPDAPTISVSAGSESVTVTITNPSDTGGGDITSYAVSALTGPIEDTTFAVTVVSDSGNKYAIDGTTQGTVTLHKGHTYIFDQSDSSNSGHPLRLSTTSNGSHGGGSEYTTGVTTSGSPGSAGAFTKIAVDSGAASTLYYYCSSHSGMGGSATVKTSLQGGASGSSSPVTVSSLTNGESYNVRASAINAFGQSPYSAASSSTPLFDRSVWFGGHDAVGYNRIDYVALASTGDASDFGDLGTVIEGSYGGAASLTRGVVGAKTSNVLQYITFASTGNTSDFGDRTVALNAHAGLSNSTRGVFGGGSVMSDVMDYITIASTGNATDFGDLSQGRIDLVGFASSTRGIFAGGEINNQTGALGPTIDYITIASAGNATDFGDCTASKSKTAGTSSSTRGLIMGGLAPSNTNVIEYITIASTGNGTDFGDLSQNVRQGGGNNNNIKAVHGGGSASGYTNVIDYVTIASTGNSQDFGDLTDARGGMASCSSNHGGLS